MSSVRPVQREFDARAARGGDDLLATQLVVQGSPQPAIAPGARSGGGGDGVSAFAPGTTVAAASSHGT
ncbi:MAG: hypothetical protein CMJ89_11290 [Planctomycetes bacterium]|nr:hypothetical protein [Planctomycetota bacterium]